MSTGILPTDLPVACWALAGLVTLGAFATGCSGGSPGSASDTDPDTNSDTDTEPDAGDPSTGDATSGTTTGSGDPGDDPTQDCPGHRIDTEGILTLDLDAIRLGLTLSVDGQALPDSTEGRGRVTLRPLDAHGELALDLGHSGSFERAVLIAPGRYDIIYEANPAACSQPEGPLPCVGGPLLSGVALDADGTLDLDLQTVRLSGEITLSGDPAPAGPRGTLRFVSKGGQFSELPPLAPSGPAQYAVRLTRGSYDVVYVAEETCDGLSPPDYPCVDGLLPAPVPAENDGILDIDIPAVTLSGSLTVDGAPMPTSTTDRGWLRVSSTAYDPEERPGLPSSAPLRSLGANDEARFGTTLVAGRYDLEFDANPGTCDGRSVPDLPCSGGIVLEDVALEQNGSLDVDLRTIQLTGHVERSGGPLPDDSVPRGELRFSPRPRGSQASFVLGASGEEIYGLRLLAGRYDIEYAPIGDPCVEDDSPVMPCVGGPLLSDLPLQQSGSLDIDVPLVRLQGDVTLSGDDMPVDGPPRGALAFSQDTELPWLKHLPRTGAARYSVALLPGSYDILYSPDPQACLEDPGQPLPCAATPHTQQLDVTSDGTYDIDIAPTRVGIELLVNGAEIPDAPDWRGHLVTRPVPTGIAHERQLDPLGPVDYLLRLLPGSYVLEHRANPQLCAESSDLEGIPCTSQVLLGCTD